MQVTYGSGQAPSMPRASLAALPCSIARTLDLVGEWWTLLIIRDALFGARRFDDFKATGIADNILAARLKRLVENGIFERQLYQQRPPRYEYLLTDKGRQLAPVLAALRQWGGSWTSGEDRMPRLLHAECGHDVAVAVICPECDRKVTAGELVREAAPTDQLAASLS
jgi:DNA-binding HxlR family transcriptional regulator